MTTANPALLASGTYYGVETAGGRMVSCGGWTLEEPGTRNVQTGVAHMRHFGTHPDWIRRGLGAAIFDRCCEASQAQDVHTFKCFSSLGAVPFYAALGFSIIERTELVIATDLKFPAVTMMWKR